MTMSTAQANRELTRFLAVALGLGLALQVPSLLNPAFLGLALIVMWTPALAVLVAGKGARASARQMLSIPWPWKTMLLASVLGWFHKVVSGLGAVALGYASFNEEHFRLSHGWTTRADFVWFFPSTGEPLPLFLLHLFAMQLVGVAIVGPLMAFGEEIGWRGYLQGELVRRFGMWRGTLAVGVIWAYWHVGFMLAGHNGGGEHRVANALVFFPFEVIVVAFLYAWLTHRTRSVLPAVCAHAANNSFPADKLFTSHSWAGDKLVSVATTVVLALVVLALYEVGRRADRRRNSDGRASLFGESAALVASDSTTGR